MDADATFGDQIKQRRRELDLTQEQLGELLGCSTVMIRKLEYNQKRPSKETLARLARVLELPDKEQERFLQAGRLRPARAAAQFDVTLTASYATTASQPRQLHSNNLPAQPTRLIGRAQELGFIQALLLEQQQRCLTLTGPGGVGKTRLAIESATRLAPHFVDGAHFVSLAPLSDPALVLATIAQTLHVEERGGLPLAAQLAAILKDQQRLIVLDNFEQLLPAAPALADLLAACPRLTLLVTSRVPLRLRWEQQLPIAPLALPRGDQAISLEAIGDSAATTLFLERIQRINPTFQLSADQAGAVAAICRRLDGLPLAIELAAARCKLVPPSQLLAWLDQPLPLLTEGSRDAPPHQQTLLRAIEWSYDLLEPHERTLFARLAVFSGGWTIEAAAAICGEPGTPPLALLDALISLQEKSMLVAGRPDAPVEAEPRLSMLETIREYAALRMQESGAVTVLRERHAGYYLALVERAEPELLGPRQVYWVRYLREEHENLRATLRWFLDQGQIEHGLHMASALWWFWSIGGYLREARQWFERLFERGAELSPPVRANALAAAGSLAWGAGDFATGRALLEQSLEVETPRRAIWATRSCIYAVFGMIAAIQGDIPGSLSLHQQSIEGLGELENPWGPGVGLGCAGISAFMRGDPVQAQALLEQGLSYMLASGDGWNSAHLLNHLGLALMQQGSSDRAIECFKQSLALLSQLEARIALAECLEGLAAIAVSQGMLGHGVELWGVSATIRKTFGAQAPPPLQMLRDHSLELARSRIEQASFCAAWQRGESMDIEASIALGLSI